MLFLTYRIRVSPSLMNKYSCISVSYFFFFFLYKGNYLEIALLKLLLKRLCASTGNGITAILHL